MVDIHGSFVAIIVEIPDVLAPQRAAAGRNQRQNQGCQAAHAASKMETALKHGEAFREMNCPKTGRELSQISRDPTSVFSAVFFDL